MSEENQAQEQHELSTEDRARSMGWLSQDEFKGAPERWTDAETYVKRADNELPIARATMRRLESEIAGLKSTISDFARHHQSVAEREYAKAMRDLKAQQKQAVNESDPEKFDRAQAEIDQLEKERVTAPTSQPTQQLDPVFVEWADENPWYGTDKRLRKVAEAIASDMVEDQTPLRGKAFLNAITKEVRLRFPDKFENSRKGEPSAVAGGSKGDLPSGKRGKGYNDLPAEARTACDRYVKAGLLTKEQYIKDFFEE